MHHLHLNIKYTNKPHPPLVLWYHSKQLWCWNEAHIAHDCGERRQRQRVNFNEHTLKCTFIHSLTHTNRMYRVYGCHNNNVNKQLHINNTKYVNETHNFGWSWLKCLKCYTYVIDNWMWHESASILTLLLLLDQKWIRCYIAQMLPVHACHQELQH